jgi:signal transduction histidine kinase
VPKIIGLATICIGMIVVVAWTVDIPTLKSIVPNAVTMKFSTAISFVFSGITIYFVAQHYEGKTNKAQITVPLSGFVIFLFMVTLLSANMVGVNSGVEQLFVKESQDAVKTSDAGRPSIMTMINFILVVISGISALSDTRPKNIVAILGYTILIIGAISVVGYIVNQPLMYYYVPNMSTAMAINTSVLFVAIGAAFVFLGKNANMQRAKSMKIRTRLMSLFLIASLIPIIFMVGLGLNNIGSASNTESKVGMIIVGIVTAIAVTIFSLMTARSISKPIIALKDVSMQISNGNRTVKADESGDDEISDLSKAFNTMINDVIKSERLSTIGMLSSTLGHDLKNNLTVMKMNLDLAGRECEKLGNESLIKKVKTVEKSANKMLSEIDDVLNFLRQAPLKLESVSFANVLEGALKTVSIPENIKIEKPVNDVQIYCDIKRMETVLVNLVNNAIQAIGVEKGIIALDAAKNNSHALIVVTDSGPGISIDALPKIFDPLFTTKNTGTGLGLASCKNIVENHGGGISVKNNPTTFTIEIPLNDSK